ncbi:hypothetical protein KO500_11775 [Cellulophaga baltica]|uniref:hypothetical protein n=1 Tax=Cellulophaga TaxID=104264 RepID=UPI001C07420A|nr:MULTISPECIES: hypothetical protein [Cellulophaga]MBU2997118.1 hypothetical protein [Cellulophaga baltica]MDO6768516.1 hypothetical protein [Cellulophaga sp. 1_MG-2023]
MGIEKDFIKREFEKLSLFLTGLIDTTKVTEPNEGQKTIDKVNDALKEVFKLSLHEISTSNDHEFITKLSTYDEVHLEKLATLLYEIIQNPDFTMLGQDFEKNSLSKKAIVLLNYIDSISTTFSINRMQIKNELKAL